MRLYQERTEQQKKDYLADGTMTEPARQRWLERGVSLETLWDWESASIRELSHQTDIDKQWMARYGITYTDYRLKALSGRDSQVYSSDLDDYQPEE